MFYLQSSICSDSLVQKVRFHIFYTAKEAYTMKFKYPLFLLILALFSLVACGQSESNSTSTTVDASGSSTIDNGTGGAVTIDTALVCINNNDAMSHDTFPYHDPNNSSVTSQLLTQFEVKESSGKGINNYPVSMVFPLKAGEHFYAGDFHIRNERNQIIPAQFNMINRWWAKDNALRHVQAHFTVDISAYMQGVENTGKARFSLHAGTISSAVENPVCVEDKTDKITIDNSLLSIEILKEPLSIITPAGELSSILVNEQGDVESSFERDNIDITIEEVGPVRAVIKISSPTDYVNPTTIKHGWALRLYVHANSALVKADFQLQNSAINTVYSGPLYFKSHELQLSGIGAAQDIQLKAETIDKEAILSAKSGSVSAENVNTFLRNFWQTFPNGLHTNETGQLSVQLWPHWKKQYLHNKYVEGDYYWLDDMKQSYKEVLFDFSMNTDEAHIEQLASSFQYPPVAIIPQSYYQATQSTLELGGYLPNVTPASETGRLPVYKNTDFTTKSYGYYKFGQDNFSIDLYRKKATSNTGGAPYSSKKFFVSANPKDYYVAQHKAVAELNIRPQWLSGYQHDVHFSQLKPSTNPYAGSTWRRFIDHNTKAYTREYIEGTSQVANPRDDQHAWFYHIEQAYLMSGNKWIKDWFEFMAEFKQVYLQELDPWPDRSNRSEGHALSVALSAFRVTGNEKLAEILKNYSVNIHSQYLLMPHNISVGSLTKSNPSAAVFQQGFLVKGFIELYQEFPDQAFTLSLIKNYVDWNYQYANYSYYRSVLDYEVSPKASGTALSFVDAAIWYAIYSGQEKYATHAINFVRLGIGGVKPYGYWTSWNGQYEGQLYHYYLQNY